MLILYNYLNYHSMFSKPYILKRRNIKTIIIKKKMIILILIFL